MTEKRQHPRRPYTTYVAIHAGAASHAGESHDLSIGGMYLETTYVAVFGQDVVIEIDLPNLGATKIPGIVRWTKPGGFGVQFGLIGARETNAISALITGL